MIQMLSATGHITIAPELLNEKMEMSLKQTKNLKFIKQILDHEKSLHLENLVIIADSQPELVIELLHKNSELVDGLVLINTPDKWRVMLNSENSNKNKLVPMVLIEDPENGYINITQFEKYQKIIHISKPSELTSIKNLMQLIANFLDFIHPR